MPSGLATADYERLYNLITAHTGLRPDKHRRKDVVRIVDRMMEEASLNGSLSLTALLDKYPFTHEIWQDLLQAVTVGETYFYRNSAHMNALRNEVLPALINERRMNGHRYFVVQT